MTCIDLGEPLSATDFSATDEDHRLCLKITVFASVASGAGSFKLGIERDVLGL